MRFPLRLVSLAILLALASGGIGDLPMAGADDLPGTPVNPAPKDAAKPASRAPDVITLDGGNQVEGRILVDGPKGVTLEITTPSGGTSKVTLPRSRIRTIAYGAKEGEPSRVTPVGPAPAREDWFLLQTDGKVIGVRSLTLRGSSKDGDTGWRIEEKLEYFTQGPHLPSLSVERVEKTDKDFRIRESIYRENGRQALAPGGPQAFMRSVTGRLAEGMWKVGIRNGTRVTSHEVLLPSDARGPLGHREFVLRATRKVGLDEVHLLDGRTGRLVAVSTGFVGLGQRPRTAPGQPTAPPRDEFHWVEHGTRRISWFGRGAKVVKETVAEGVVAIPVTRAQAFAAETNATRRKAEPDERRIALARGGIGFELPDPSWRWTPEKVARPGATWHVLGLVDAPVYTANVRIELHDHEARVTPGMQTGSAWLQERLKSVCPDLRLAQKVQPLTGIQGGWRVGYTGTLRGQTIYTLAVVIDRGEKRTVLLVACPKSAWETAQPSLERFIASVNLL